MRRRVGRVWVGVALGVGALLALWALWGRQVDRPTGAGAVSEPPGVSTGGRPEALGAPAAASWDSSAGLPYGLRLRPGLVLDYELSHREDGSANAGMKGRELAGHLQVDGLLRLEVLASGGQPLHVSLTIPRVDALDWTILGSPLPTDEARAAYFDHREATLVVADDGRVDAIYFPPDSPKTFANIATRIARQLQTVVAPQETTWSKRLDTGFGVVNALFSLRGCDERGCEVTMDRVSGDYEEIFPNLAPGEWDATKGDGHLSFRLAPNGYVDRAEARERVELWSGERLLGSHAVATRIRLLSASWHDPRRSTVVDLDWVKANELPDHALENALRKRAAGMTPEQLRADILRWGNGGRVPQHNRWLARATAVLALHPEMAKDLAALALDPSMRGRGKALIIDLLADVGHPEAQAALREVWGNPLIQKRDDYPQLLQHVALLQRPDSKTVALLADSYANSERPDTRLAAAVALGGAIGRSAQDDPGVARARAEGLARDLAASHDDLDRRALLSAIGNTKMDRFVDDVLPYTDSDDAGVRGHAASALRGMDSPEASERLLDMAAGDPDPAVQRVAIRGLSDRTLSPEQLTRFAEAIQQGTIDPDSVIPLLGALHRMQDRVSPEALLPVVEALAALPTLAPTAAHKVRELLHALER